jgi:serine/threonine-protein kinase
MEQVIIKAMALEREKRYQSMADLEQALEQCANGNLALPPTVQASVPVITPAQPAQPAWPAPPAWPNQAAAQPRPQPIPQPIPQHVPAQQPAWNPPVQPTWTPPPSPSGPICDTCGRMNKPGARFCTGCGSPIKLPVPKLVITSPRAVWEMPLQHLPCRIGRRDPVQNHHPEIDLAEHDRGIASRRHAVIQQQGDRYQLVDQGSVNGTSVNGVTMTAYQPHTLRPGDRIRIGDVEMVFSIE